MKRINTFVRLSHFKSINNNNPTVGTFRITCSKRNQQHSFVVILFDLLITDVFHLLNYILEIIHIFNHLISYNK